MRLGGVVRSGSRRIGRSAGRELNGYGAIGATAARDGKGGLLGSAVAFVDGNRCGRERNRTWVHYRRVIVGDGHCRRRRPKRCSARHRTDRSGEGFVGFDIGVAVNINGDGFRGSISCDEGDGLHLRNVVLSGSRRIGHSAGRELNRNFAIGAAGSRHREGRRRGAAIAFG